MSALIEVESYRPGRYRIRINDRVRCRPTTGGAFDAKVLKIRADAESREVRELDVIGGAGGRRMVRTMRPDQVVRRRRVQEDRR